jgi:hypothetical protein
MVGMKRYTARHPERQTKKPHHHDRAFVLRGKLSKRATLWLLSMISLQASTTAAASDEVIDKRNHRHNQQNVD